MAFCGNNATSSFEQIARRRTNISNITRFFRWILFL